MKVKFVKQYKCDFCGKKKYQAGAMRSHEKHCTMNPGRYCRMCDHTGGHGLEMSELLEMLPDPVIKQDFGYETITNIEEINEAIKKLRNNVEGCTVCILAAIRQKGIPVPATNFNYKKELDSFWSDYNNSRDPQYGYHF